MLTRRNLLKASLGLTALTLAGCGGDVTPAAPEELLSPLQQLARNLEGGLLLPDSPGYLQAALPWNLRFADILPQAIAQCQSAQDVRTALLWAQDNGVPLVARSGGHSYAGFSTTTGLMIDLTAMNAGTVAGDLVTFQGGSRLKTVGDFLRPFSRSIPHGRCPAVGLAGLTLGGGIGFDMRAHGLTIDALRETEVVLADGSILTCNESENSDLFWACRGGGGGNFGINTSFTYRTFPVDLETVYDIFWDDQLERLLPLMLELLPTFSRKLGAKVSVYSNGQIELLGQLRGTPAELLELFAPFLQVPPSSQSVELLGYWDAVDYLAELDTTDYSQERSRYIFEPFDAAAAAPVILDFLRRYPGTGLPANWKIFLAGEAVAELGPEATAYVHRPAMMVSSIELDWLASTPPEVVERNRRWLDEFHEAMAPLTSGQCYQNFIDESQRDYLEAYYGANLARLIQVKRKYDPHDVFRFPQGIPLA